MKKKLKIIYLTVMAVIMIGGLYGVYGWYIPNKLNSEVPQMKRLLKDNGYTNAKRTDMSIIGYNTEFSVTNSDGNDTLVNVAFINGNYQIKY